MENKGSHSISANARIGLLVGATAALVCILEYPPRGSVQEVLSWFQATPLLALVNFVLAGAVLAIFVAVTGKIAPGLVLTSLVLGAAAYVNATKIVHLRQPFFAWDILYYEQVLVLFKPMLKDIVDSHLFPPATAGGIILFCYLFGSGKTIRWPLRFLLMTAGVLVLGLFTYHRELPRDLPSLLRTRNLFWEQRANYKQNGFLLAFVLNVRPVLIGAPDGYGADAVRRLLGPLSVDEHRAELEPDEKARASLILFVSESFSDLRYVDHEAEVDPLENFNRLRSRFPSFTMISPTFGGSTSNVEFEMLTGLTNAFLPPGAVPYDHYLQRATPSLPWTLRRNGYRTIAIHPYHDWFWNRKRAYPLLGFEDFISLEDFTNPEFRGPFVSDAALTEKIIQEIEGIREPYFLHVISMQNHGVYEPGRYPSDEIAVRGDFPEEARPAIQTYVTGLRDADRSLARLVEYLASRSEPVILLFCGDHLPSFGVDQGVYKISGPASHGAAENVLGDHFKMSSVPCLLWANRQGLLDGVRIPDQMSPLYFAPLLLNLLDVEMPPHLRWLWRRFQDYPVIHRKFVRRRGSGLVDFKSAANDSFLRGLKILQYDILFGEGHALRQDRSFAWD